MTEPTNTPQAKKQLKTILRCLMEEVDINEADLARKTGLPQPTLHRILSGSTKSPRGESLSRLANFFAISISQLIGDVPLPSDRIPGTHNPLAHGWISLPIISWEQASDWLQYKDDPKQARWSEWTSTDLGTSKSAYALVVKGEAMAPRFVEGTLLIIEPKLTANDRDYVIVRQKGHTTATFKQLLVDGQDKYLKPLNPDFKTIVFDGSEHEILGVMVQSRMDYRAQETFTQELETEEN